MLLQHNKLLHEFCDRKGILGSVSGPPNGPIFKGQTVQEDLLDYLTKLKPIGCPETSVANYQPTLRKIPEERTFYLHHSGSPKSLVTLGCIKTRNRLVKTQQKFILSYVLTVHKEHLQRKTTTCFGQL
jgi:hypothetical protein